MYFHKGDNFEISEDQEETYIRSDTEKSTKIKKKTKKSTNLKLKRKGRLKEKICSDCGESFRNEILLNRHMRDKHDFQGKDFYFFKGELL